MHNLHFFDVLNLCVLLLQAPLWRRRAQLRPSRACYVLTLRRRLASQRATPVSPSATAASRTHCINAEALPGLGANSALRRGMHGLLTLLHRWLMVQWPPMPPPLPLVVCRGQRSATKRYSPPGRPRSLPSSPRWPDDLCCIGGAAAKDKERL